MTQAVSEPSFLAERRAAAQDALGGLELPSFRGVAGWEFTPVDDLALEDWEPAAGAQPGTVEGPLAAPEGAARPSAEAATSEGPIVMTLAQAAEQHPELVERHLGSVVPTGSTALVARNDAQWSDGTFVYVPRGVALDAPVWLETIHEAAGTSLSWRLLVVLEEGAQAEVWHQSLSADAETEGLLNGVVELVVGEGARLRFVDAQALNEKSWLFGSQRAVVARDGAVDWVTLGFGSANGKVFLETKLDGPGADARVTGAYAIDGRQHVDYDTLQEHAAPDTTSDLAFRGILDGRSTAVWRGMIQVDEGAQSTDAFQESRNLLLSRKAHADAIPGLEILANDVRCTHAAAIAQVDPDQLFYLRSHGLPEGDARRLVIEGFLHELVERFEEGALRDAVTAAIEERMRLILSA
jgi:Fe-S cluster assembly protein SufD